MTCSLDGNGAAVGTGVGVTGVGDGTGVVAAGNGFVDAGADPGLLFVCLDLLVLPLDCLF